jgi:hypothetical protein
MRTTLRESRGASGVWKTEPRARSLSLLDSIALSVRVRIVVRYVKAKRPCGLRLTANSNLSVGTCD